MLGMKSPVMIAPEQALPGRQTPIPTDAFHAVLKTPLKGPYPEGAHTAIFGMGCFWGVERLFWRLSGVFVTAAGYAGGYTPNPTYEEVCSGLTGHTEVVLVVFDPLVITYKDLLKTFWENHDPTQGMRQGGDIGTQYRSALYTTTEAQAAAAEDSKRAYAAALAGKGYGDVTTEIAPAPPFYFAEGYHQGYLQKNPGGYCGLKGSGVVCIL